MARKKKGAFRTISEVSKWLDTPTHVLRFWESKFKGIEPVKRAGGRRYYRPEDLELIGGIKVLLHDEGKSIASVVEMIDSEGEDTVNRSQDAQADAHGGRRRGGERRSYRYGRHGPAGGARSRGHAPRLPRSPRHHQRSGLERPRRAPLPLPGYDRAFQYLYMFSLHV